MHSKTMAFLKNCFVQMLSNRRRLVLTIMSVALASILFLLCEIFVSSYVNSLYAKAEVYSKDGVLISGSLTEDVVSNIQIKYDDYSQTKFSLPLTSFTTAYAIDDDFHIGVLPTVVGASAGLFQNPVLSTQSDDFLFDSYIVSGRDIETDDIVNKKYVVVISEMAEDIMFGGESAVGKTIELSITGQEDDAQAYTVIGVYADSIDENTNYERIKTAKQTGEQSINVLINCYVPISIVGSNNVSAITVNVGDDIDTKNSIATYFSASDYIETNYYEAEINEISEMNEQFLNITNILAIVVMVIAGFNLFNSMMFALRSRISEVGIRKAMGADSSDILVQFMLEAIFSALAGALVAACIASLASTVIQIYLYNYSYTSMYLVLTPLMLLKMFLYVFIMSLVAGIMPAIQASRISIVEAIRFD